MRNRVAEAGCLSSIVATVIIAVIALVEVGVTSTLPLGLMFTLGIAFAVSVATLAILAFVRKLRSPWMSVLHPKRTLGRGSIAN